MSFEEILKADEGLRKEEEDNGDPVAVLTVTVAVAMLMPQLVLTEGVLGCCFSSPVPSMLLLLTAAGAIMWDQRELRHAVEGHAHVGMAKALPFVSASLDTQTENGATLHSRGVQPRKSADGAYRVHRKAVTVFVAGVADNVAGLVRMEHLSIFKVVTQFRGGETREQGGEMIWTWASLERWYCRSPS